MSASSAPAHGNVDARLRVVFDNGAESNLLMRSFQKALQQDDTGRRIVEPSTGLLFADKSEEGDEPSGVVYVLRSKSDPTFLMADVEIGATYELYNITRSRLQNRHLGATVWSSR